MLSVTLCTQCYQVRNLGWVPRSTCPPKGSPNAQALGEEARDTELSCPQPAKVTLTKGARKVAGTIELFKAAFAVQVCVLEGIPFGRVENPPGTPRRDKTPFRESRN
ncbi:acyl-CoA dehydrogenase [Platysternon megacephalum]|uniref:Acyl-CoA dehydrogenase n=1 Tax=Platysternon megacephalum TaxID=55544 RepID=A0A4D9DBF8_9SAUR|nr:acyl-CoA dehydrogenase [Platysternon megacephalum]